jgi:ubiquitin conjugation factor E4 B
MPETKASSMAESETPKPTISIVPKPAPKITITNRLPNTGKPPTTRQTSEPLETWIDRALCSIFRISLRSQPTTDASGNSLIYLPGVSSELEESKLPILVTLEVLEQAILEAASNTGDGKPFKYLLACFKRLMRAFRGLRSTDPTEPRYVVLKEARRLCMSYAIFAVTMPEMFGVEEAADTSPLVEHFLSDPEKDTGICPDFLAEAVSRFPEDQSIRDALVSALEQLSAQLAGLTMNDEYKPYVAALKSAVRHRPLAEAISESPKFLPVEVAPERIEYDSFLGPFFALSPLKTKVAVNYFMGAQSQGPGFIANSQNAVRMSLRTHQDELHEITNFIIRAAKEPRERLLDWFALTINKNHKRRGTWVDTKTVATDAFMINVTSILDRLCDPFMGTTFEKLDRIDVDYLRRSPRIVIADETKINADQKTSDEFYAQSVGGTNNFISEIFFLTVAAHHYGTEAANDRVSQIEREIRHLEEQMELAKEQRAKFVSVRCRLNLAMLTQSESGAARGFRPSHQTARGHAGKKPMRAAGDPRRPAGRADAATVDAVDEIRHRLAHAARAAGRRLPQAADHPSVARGPGDGVSVPARVPPGRHCRQLQVYDAQHAVCHPGHAVRGDRHHLRCVPV